MSNSLLNPHQHCRDFQCSFTTAQARLQSLETEKEKKNYFLLLHDAAVIYKLIENQVLLIYEIKKIPKATPNILVISTKTSCGRGNTQFFLFANLFS